MSRDKPPEKADTDRDEEKIRLGFFVVIIGMVLAVVIFLAAMYRYSSAGDVATSIGPITTLIGTLAGAFFGQQIGSAGRERAQRTAIKLAASTRLSPDEVKKLLE